MRKYAHPWDHEGMPRVNERTNRDGTVTYFVRTRRADGKQTSERFSTKREAEQFAKRVAIIGGPAAIAERARRDHMADEYVPTLAEWLAEHVRRLTGVTDRTKLDYLAIGRRTFLPTLGERPVDTITRGDVADLINGLERQGLSAKTISNTHGLLSAVMATAVIEQHIDANPCHRMRLPRSREVERRDERFLTHAEYARLIGQIPERWRALVVTMFGTGLRWSEVTALEVRDVHVHTTPPTLRVTKAWKATPGRPLQIGPPKSAKSRRTVMLPRQVVDALTPLLDRPGPSLLFTAPQGGIVRHGSWRDRVWLPACRRASLASPHVKGEPYDGPRIHDARHTHASWLLEQGATIEQVQDQLGHESLLTTRKVYGHLQPAMRASLADAATRAMALAAGAPELEG